MLLPVNVSDGVEAPTSTSERAYIVYEHQRTQQIPTERRAGATKCVASVPMPQMNRHLISLDRTAVANEHVLAYDSRDTMEVKAEPPNFMRTSDERHKIWRF